MNLFPYGLDMFAGKIYCEDYIIFNSCSEEIGLVWYVLILLLITALIITVVKLLKIKKENRKNHKILFTLISIIAIILVFNIYAIVYIKISVNNSNAKTLQNKKDCFENNKSSKSEYIMPCEDY